MALQNQKCARNNTSDQKLGRGIEKILLAEPETRFTEIGRQFKTVFPRKTITSKTTETTQKLPRKSLMP